MKEREIKNRLKRAMDQAPINLLDDLLSTDVEKETVPDELTGRKIYIEEPPEKPKGKILSFPNIYRTVLLAASLVFALLGGNHFYQNMTIGQLYLDINPSFVVEVKRNDKVKEIRPLNFEAYDVLEGNYYKNVLYEEALTEILYKVEEKGYLLEDVNVLLVSSKEKNNKDDLARIASQDIINHFDGKREDVIVLRQNLSDDDDIISGIENLLKNIATREGIEDISELYNMTLKELIIYLKVHNINLEDYVDVVGDTDALQESKSEIIEAPPIAEPAPPVETPPIEAPTVPEPTHQYDDDDDDDDDDRDDSDDDWDDDDWDDHDEDDNDDYDGDDDWDDDDDDDD